MDLKIIGEHLEITEGMKEHILSKFSHLPLPEKMQHAEIRIGKNSPLTFHVKINANYNHKSMSLEVSDKDAYVGIDTLMKKIHVYLTKQKETHRDNNNHFSSAPR
jgi:ribosomal subunit interface protein